MGLALKIFAAWINMMMVCPSKSWAFCYNGLAIDKTKLVSYLAAVTWLKSHIINVVECNFDYTDEQNCERLLELADELFPARKEYLLSTNAEQ